MGSKPARESELDVGSLVKESVEEFGGKGGGRKDYGQGMINNKDLSTTDVHSYLKQKLNLL